MHDQPIQLDAGFDQMPRLSVSSWLHTIDSRVVSGEPIVIIDDGSTQRVVTAPCTGRIVDIYTEVGAQVLPRTVLGMVRPDLVMPEPPQGLSSIILGILMIGLAVIAIPIVTNVSTMSMPSLPSMPSLIADDSTPSANQEADQTDAPFIDSPMPDAPLPGSSPSDDMSNPDASTDPNIVEGMPNTSEDPNQFIEPTPSDPNADISDPNADISDPNADISDPNVDSGDASQPEDTGTSDSQTPQETPVEESTGTFTTNENIDWEFTVGMSKIVELTKEVQRNLPSTGVMSQKEYDDTVSYASNEVVQVVDQLMVIVSNNSNNTDINERNRRWFELFNDSKDDCLAIYVTIKQSVQSQQPIPDLSSSFDQCYAAESNS